MRRLGELSWLAVLLCAGCGEVEESPEVGLQEMGYSMTVDGFHRAAEIGDVAVLGRMLEGGMTVDCRDDDGHTALHHAAGAGSEQAIRFLVEQGVDVDVRGFAERTPLMTAAEMDEAGSIRELLRLGAKPELADEGGFRALTRAADQGSAEAVEALAVSSRPFLDDALLLSCLRGHDGCVALLADYGASVYARMEDGSTPLMLAAREGHVEVVEVLLERGANRFAVDLLDRTAGQIASEAGHVELAARLNAAPGEDAFALPEIAGFEGGDEPGGEASTPAVAVAGRREEGVAGVDGVPVDLERDGESLGESNGDAWREDRAGSGVVTSGVPVGAEVETAKGEVGVVMERYEATPLPLRVEGVEEGEVRVRYLFGDQEEVTVREGEVIPLTRLRVVGVEQKRDHSKMTGGLPADVSVVEVEDPETGQRRRLTAKLGANAHEPFAVLRAGKAGAPVMARPGTVLRGGDGQHYRVMDVRPAQVVVEEVETGRVMTLKLKKN